AGGRPSGGSHRDSWQRSDRAPPGRGARPRILCRHPFLRGSAAFLARLVFGRGGLVAGPPAGGVVPGDVVDTFSVGPSAGDRGRLGGWRKLARSAPLTRSVRF